MNAISGRREWGGVRMGEQGEKAGSTQGPKPAWPFISQRAGLGLVPGISKAVMLGGISVSGDSGPIS